MFLSIWVFFAYSSCVPLEALSFEYPESLFNSYAVYLVKWNVQLHSKYNHNKTRFFFSFFSKSSKITSAIISLSWWFAICLFLYSFDTYSRLELGRANKFSNFNAASMVEFLCSQQIRNVMFAVFQRVYSSEHTQNISRVK